MAETNLTADVVAPPKLCEAVEKEAVAWTSGGRLGRLWQRDPTLWTGGDEGHWLGWLEVPDPDGPEVRRLEAFAAQVRRDGFVGAALLGMGGSSLCPEMLQRIFGSAGGVELRVLDSTDPAQVRAFESTLDIDRTLFVVSSKSGTTLETSLLHAHFFERVRERSGKEAAGARFVAVTDPGSALDRLATERGFRVVFHGEASIGGRYSALSYFGLAPAALVGLDLRLLLGRARAMADACGPQSPASENPGVQLGLLLGVSARAGRDKATLVASPGLDGFGAWGEQLLAESTGKDGRGIVPVEGERLDDASVYGDDRVFVATTLTEESDEGREEALDALAGAGHPVVRIRVRDKYDVAAECFRWEFATAVAGAVLGVHPFDQPDVEASKVATRAITSPTPANARAAPASPVAELAHDAGGRLRLRGAAVLHGAAAVGGCGRAAAGLGHRALAPIAPAGLLRRAGVPRNVRSAAAGSRRAAPPGARGDAGGDDGRLRAALPPLHGPGPQGRSGRRAVPDTHLRPRRGPAGAAPGTHVRGRRGRTGRRRLHGARSAPTALAAPAPRRRRRERARDGRHARVECPRRGRATQERAPSGPGVCASIRAPDFPAGAARRQSEPKGGGAQASANCSPTSVKARA